jgi:hypothetical protein
MTPPRNPDDEILRFDADQIERLGPAGSGAAAPPPGPGPRPTGSAGVGAPPAGPAAPQIPWKFLLGTLAGATITAGMSYLLRNLNDFTEAQQSSSRAPNAPRGRATRRRRRRRNRRRAKRRNRQQS